MTGRMAIQQTLTIARSGKAGTEFAARDPEAAMADELDPRKQNEETGQTGEEHIAGRGDKEEFEDIDEDESEDEADAENVEP
jgi:hypothetical protein